MDETVRSELKTFSNWPTYPQVNMYISISGVSYVLRIRLPICNITICSCLIYFFFVQLYIKGELVGGLDIIKEMVESNELQSMIPKKANSLEQRMKELISSGNVMVFMKGNKNEPRCGFSRTLMEILHGKCSQKWIYRIFTYTLIQP